MTTPATPTADMLAAHKTQAVERLAIGLFLKKYVRLTEIDWPKDPVLQDMFRKDADDLVWYMQQHGFIDTRYAAAQGDGDMDASPAVAYEDGYQQALKDVKHCNEDHKRLVRELDVALNGEEGAAKQAALCDIVGQVKREGICSPKKAHPEGAGDVREDFEKELLKLEPHARMERIGDGYASVYTDFDWKMWKSSYNKGLYDGWMRCGVHHVDIGFEDEKQKSEAMARMVK